MFGFKSKPQHVHTWSAHINIQYLVSIFGYETEFSTICTHCGRSGRYGVDGYVSDERLQRMYAHLAMKNGWFQ